MRRTKKFATVVVGVILLAAIALFSAGCRGGNSNTANSSAKQAGVTEANTAATPTQNTTAQTATTPATPASTPGAGGTVSLPITDAAAFRDRLLELARNAAFDSRKNAQNGNAIREAWQKQYPQLKFAFFYSMAADPNTVSASDEFLTTGAAVSGNYDRLYAFAVADTKGKCAGGAAVIPGDTATRKVSDMTVPAVFKPIEMSNAKACTGEAAGENYRP